MAVRRSKRGGNVAPKTRARCRVGGVDELKRHQANDPLTPPLIEADRRFSRIRLSVGGHSSPLLQRLDFHAA